MARNFEFDANGHVVTELSQDPGVYINDRVQEIVATRYSFIINETALLLYPANNELDKFKRLAYSAGSAVTLESLEHSDLDRHKIDYIKHSFLYRTLPRAHTNHNPKILKDQIEHSSLVGHISHQELEHISNIVSRYYVDVAQNTDLRSAVFFGVGRTAFILDKCFESLRALDPKFDFARTIEETDFDSVNWHDLLEE